MARLLVGTLLLGLSGRAAAGYQCPAAAAAQPRRAVGAVRRAPEPAAQWGGFKVQKSDRLLIREAWERADSYRPGKPNWFTQTPKDLVELHEEMMPKIDELPSLREEVDLGGIPGSGNRTSLLGALLKSLSTGDLALTLCSKEPQVLTDLRDWLVAELPMEIAVKGLPEEQGRVLSTLVRSMDARTILDLGTFTGYSSIAMALAAADDATVTCCETSREWANHARDWWLKAGVVSKMQMNECGAEELLPRLLSEGQAGKVDMIFCDVGERERYAELHELHMQLLRVGGVVVYYDTLWCADEVLQHEPYPQMRAFSEKLASDPRVLASLVPLSYGITIAIKTMSLDGPGLEAARAAGDDDALVALLKARREEVAAEIAALS